MGRRVKIGKEEARRALEGCTEVMAGVGKVEGKECAFGEGDAGSVFEREWYVDPSGLGSICCCKALLT